MNINQIHSLVVVKPLSFHSLTDWVSMWSLVGPLWNRTKSIPIPSDKLSIGVLFASASSLSTESTANYKPTESVVSLSETLNSGCGYVRVHASLSTPGSSDYFEACSEWRRVTCLAFNLALQKLLGR